MAEVFNPWDDTKQNQASERSKERIAELMKKKADLAAQPLPQPEPFPGQVPGAGPGMGPGGPGMGPGNQIDQATLVRQRNEQLHEIDKLINETRTEAAGLNPDGSPKAVEWKSLIDPTTGQMRDQYQAKIGALDPSSWEGYQKLKTESLRGPGVQSEWAKLQSQKQMGEEAQAKQNAAQQALSSQSQALSQLGMRGGYGSGARTLAALGTQRSLIGANQGVGLQGMQNRLGIATTDEGNRLAGLQNLSASEQDIGKYNKGLEAKQVEYNLNNLMKEIEGRRGNEQSNYQEGMKKWAAGQQAAATERAGSGGGGGTWVCTRIDKASPLSNETKKALLRLKNYGAKVSPDLSDCYLYRCEELAQRMDDAGVDWSTMNWFTDRITSLVQEKRMQNALDYYLDAIIIFTEKFWPDTKDETLIKCMNAKNNKNVEVLNV